ncbi:MAG: hypothetical protein JOS17DRAFT_764731 [Linnemannia elongata]|nr:MAG: hypothetical protein JOS17DRAFT_764731 [Linnemannia elongata]
MIPCFSFLFFCTYFHSLICVFICFTYLFILLLLHFVTTHPFLMLYHSHHRFSSQKPTTPDRFLDCSIRLSCLDRF